MEIETVLKRFCRTDSVTLELIRKSLQRKE